MSKQWCQVGSWIQRIDFNNEELARSIHFGIISPVVICKALILDEITKSEYKWRIEVV